MLAVHVDNIGPASALRYAQAPDPTLRPSDVLVRNRAAGVNRTDLSFRRGAHGDADWGDSPLIGLEVAGEIVAMGSDVAGWRIGERVMAVVGGGGYAQLSRVDYRMLMPIPAGMDDIQAAAIPEVFITAHQALCHLGELRQNETLLLHAAASGVGTAAVQLARAIGARVIATASASKHARLMELGVSHCIDRSAEDFEPAVASLTDGRGVDVILDFVGASYVERNIRSLAYGGRLVQAGLMDGNASQPLPMSRLVSRHLKIMGTVMKSRPLAEKCAMTRRFADRWLAEFATGRLQPVVDAVYPITEAEAAHQRVASNAGFGKVVLTIA